MPGAAAGIYALPLEACLAAASSSGLRVSWLQGGPGETPRSPKSEIAGVYHIPWWRLFGSPSPRGSFGEIDDLADWASRKAIGEGALEWESGVLG